MKKKLLLLFICFFALTFVQAAQDSFSYDSLTVNWTSIIQVSSQAEKVTAIINSYPRNDADQNQVVNLQASTIPQAEIQYGNNLTLNWDGNAQGILNINLNGIVSRVFTLNQILYKVNHPEDIAQEILPYTFPSKFIDSDNQYIKLKAQEIRAMTSDPTDTLELVYNIANYVSENVEYDMAYFSEIKPASWVLQNKKGVCDEYTNLFVALCRALGIPARYISGIAYSNIDNKFSEHAWAEVYIGGKWIPYDTTFNQFGWIDSTHISYNKNLDSSEASTSVTYLYVGGQISESSQKPDIVQLSHGQKLQPLTQISAEPVLDKTGFNSFIPLEVSIKNLQPYYLSESIVLNVAPGIYGKNSKNVFLKPYSEAKVYFILNISDIPQCRGIRLAGCQSSIGLSTIFGDNYMTKIFISEKSPSMSLEEAKAIVQKSQVGTSLLSCIPDKQEYYDYDNITILCGINSAEQLQICLRDDCQTADSQIKQVSFIIPAKDETGTFNILAKKDSEVIASSSFSVKLSSIPVIKLKSIETPKKIIYGEETYVNLTVESSQNLDAIVSIEKIGNFSAKLNQGTSKAKISFPTLKLGSGVKNLEINVLFKDKNGQEYSVKDFAQFEIQDVNFLQKIIVWIKFLFGF